MPNNNAINEILSGLEAGQVVPYLGNGVWAGRPRRPHIPQTNCNWSPSSPSVFTVSHKLRKNLTGAAQYIENFKHRKTLVGLMKSAFEGKSVPGDIHEFIASLHRLRWWWMHGTTMRCNSHWRSIRIGGKYKA